MSVYQRGALKVKCEILEAHTKFQCAHCPVCNLRLNIPKPEICSVAHEDRDWGDHYCPDCGATLPYYVNTWLRILKHTLRKLLIQKMQKNIKHNVAKMSI